MLISLLANSFKFGGVCDDLIFAIFMPPTSKKLRGHIGLGLSVQSSDMQSVCDA